MCSWGSTWPSKYFVVQIKTEDRASPRKMKSKDKTSSSVQVLLANLKACGNTGNIQRGKIIHAEIVLNGHNFSIYVATSLVHMYSKCGSMVEAHQVFESMKHKDVVSWTALIMGYADNGKGSIALDLFTRMRSQSCSPNARTFVAALKACTCLAQQECRDRGKEIHGLASEAGCDSDLYVQSSLIDMYSKCGSMVDARHVFDRMRHRDMVTWTTLILGYVDNGESLTALDMFTSTRSERCSLDSWVIVAALKACANLALKRDLSGRAECRDRGKQIHAIAIENRYDSQIHVQSTLIDMYAKCASMKDARQVFDSMKHRNVVSWTALVLGYVDNGDGVTALDMFTRMRSQGCSPNFLTFVAALKACGLLGALEFGRKLHGEIATGIEIDVTVVNCLVDFYAKCGNLAEARDVFDSYPKTRSLVTWNALLAGHSRLGDSEVVFKLFERMQDARFQPDGVTFTYILTCCSHAGLVGKAKELFKAMSSKYGIDPAIEHYNCMVDVLSRSNKLDDAVELLQSMPCDSKSQSEVAWMTVLGACRKWKNIEIGRLAFQHLMSYDRRNATAYGLMAQIYGSRGMWHEKEMTMVKREKVEI